MLRDTGKEVKKGDIILYVKTKSPEGVKPTVMAKIDEIDVDAYLRLMFSMLDQVLEGFGMSAETVQGETTMDAFWSDA